MRVDRRPLPARERARWLLATTALVGAAAIAAMMAAGGSRPALAAGCSITQNGGTAAATTNSGSINCIAIENGATVTGNVTNTSTGRINAAGAGAPGDIGITINNSTIGGTIVNQGSITANDGGILVFNNAAVSGGISNSGTISAVGIGINLLGVSPFSGGITNTGALTGNTGISLGSQVAAFSGAIVNSGNITGTGGTAIDVSNAHSAITIDQEAGTITGGINLSANADVLNVSGGVINGNVLGGGSGNTINFAIGSGTFTYGAAYSFIGINAVNVNSGTVILDGESNATTTTVNGGNLQIGDAATPGALLVSAVNVDGGTLSGHGTVEGLVTVSSGGTLAPGGSIGTLTIAGALTFNAGSRYGIQISDTAASNTLVIGAPGTATINGGTVTVTQSFTLGAHGGTTFTILTATGGRTGTFASVSGSANFTGTLSLGYDADDVFLNVGKGFEILPQPIGGNTNQSNVVNGINTAILSGNTVPAAIQTLNGLSGPAYLNALTQLDGEAAAGAQVGAFQLGSMFLNLMLGDGNAGFINTGDGNIGFDNQGGNNIGFINQGSNNAGFGNQGVNNIGFGNQGGINTGFRNQGSNNIGSGNQGNYNSGLHFAPNEPANALPPDIALAYAGVLKAPPKRKTFAQRWTAWSAAFGGRATTNGNPAVGSNNVATGTYGYAAGIDYHYSPGTALGFALAGGGTNWSLAQGLGTGRSDVFLAGVRGVTSSGPAYLAGALAFANGWFTTNRTAFAGDQLNARFQGQSYSARLESGYRFADPMYHNAVGVTPYAALQTQWFRTPDYSEADPTGGGFALSYKAMNGTDTRSELGGRFDYLTVVANRPLILRAKVAWAHDWLGNPSLNASFATLPGSSFTVFGAPTPHDSALTSAGAQLFFTRNWSFLAKFDGAFGNGSQLYAGSGTLRYTW